MLEPVIQLKQFGTTTPRERMVVVGFDSDTQETAQMTRAEYLKKLPPNSVETASLTDQCVTAEKLAPGAIIPANLAESTRNLLYYDLVIDSDHPYSSYTVNEIVLAARVLVKVDVTLSALKPFSSCILFRIEPSVTVRVPRVGNVLPYGVSIYGGTLEILSSNDSMVFSPALVDGVILKVLGSTQHPAPVLDGVRINNSILDNAYAQSWLVRRSDIVNSVIYGSGFYKVTFSNCTFNTRGLCKGIIASVVNNSVFVNYTLGSGVFQTLTEVCGETITGAIKKEYLITTLNKCSGVLTEVTTPLKLDSTTIGIGELYPESINVRDSVITVSSLVSVGINASYSVRSVFEGRTMLEYFDLIENSEVGVSDGTWLDCVSSEEDPYKLLYNNVLCSKITYNAKRGLVSRWLNTGDGLDVKFYDYVGMFVGTASSSELTVNLTKPGNLQYATVTDFIASSTEIPFKSFLHTDVSQAKIPKINILSCLNKVALDSSTLTVARGSGFSCNVPMRVIAGYPDSSVRVMARGSRLRFSTPTETISMSRISAVNGGLVATSGYTFSNGMNIDISSLELADSAMECSDDVVVTGTFYGNGSKVNLNIKQPVLLDAAGNYSYKVIPVLSNQIIGRFYETLLNGVLPELLSEHIVNTTGIYGSIGSSNIFRIKKWCDGYGAVKLCANLVQISRSNMFTVLQLGENTSTAGVGLLLRGEFGKTFEGEWTGSDFMDMMSLVPYGLTVINENDYVA